MTERRVLIFANGVVPDLEAARLLIRPDDLIICADGGSRHAHRLGLVPSVLIGDLDSLESQGSDAARAGATEIRRHPHDKDQTDLELALDYALSHDPSSIVVVGALGGRLDHTLGNISLLLDPRLAGRDCCLDDGLERVLLCRDHAQLHGDPGDLVSLLPWQGPTGGVRTEGLHWSLSGETLHPERSRGISNEMQGRLARVQVDSGLLLIVHRRLSTGRVGA